MYTIYIHRIRHAPLDDSGIHLTSLNYNHFDKINRKFILKHNLKHFKVMYTIESFFGSWYLKSLILLLIEEILEKKLIIIFKAKLSTVSQS